MGRGKGKTKKSSLTNHEDPVSGEEEKIPTQKKRGRPQKSLKNEAHEKEVEQKHEEHNEVNNDGTENGKKRKQPSDLKTEGDNGNGARSNGGELKSNGFRHVGSRRKNPPHRAAEAGVVCS